MTDWDKLNEIGIDDDPEVIREKQEMQRLVRWQAITTVGGAIGLIAAAAFTWANAPAVGGEWWFYLRFIVVTVAALVGFVCGRLVTFLALILSAFIAENVGGGS